MAVCLQIFLRWYSLFHYPARLNRQYPQNSRNGLRNIFINIILNPGFPQPCIYTSHLSKDISLVLGQIIFLHLTFDLAVCVCYVPSVHVQVSQNFDFQLVTPLIGLNAVSLID